MPRVPVLFLAGTAVLLSSFVLIGSLAEEPSDLEFQRHPAWSQLAVLDSFDDPVIVNFTDTDVHRILLAIGEVAGFDVDFTHGPAGKVSAEYGTTTVGEALVRLAMDQGLHYSLEQWGLLTVHGPYLPGVGDVTNPRILERTRVQPAYPEAARKDKIQGSAILQVLVDTDGTIGSMVVLREDPPDYRFGEAAMDAVGQWRYDPATKDGVPVPVLLTIVVQFSLE